MIIIFSTIQSLLSTTLSTKLPSFSAEKKANDKEGYKLVRQEIAQKKEVFSLSPNKSRPETSCFFTY